MSGARSYHAGLAAEETVERHYMALGYETRERRWRGKAGEIDLIMGRGGMIVCVEVKTSASLEAALSALSQRQLGRIALAAEEYTGDQIVPVRVDLAAVGPTGDIEIVENITV